MFDLEVLKLIFSTRRVVKTGQKPLYYYDGRNGEEHFLPGLFIRAQHNPNFSDSLLFTYLRERTDSVMALDVPKSHSWQTYYEDLAQTVSY